MSSEKVLYTAKVHTTGGREGATRSADGRLEVPLSRPGGAGEGTNPEQLFAAGWSACYLSAMQHVAGLKKIVFPKDASVDAEVDLCQNEGGFFLKARLNVSLPGIERGAAQALANEAHGVCPYSKGTRGNVLVTTTVV